MSYLARITRVASHGPVRPRRAATRARTTEPAPKPMTGNAAEFSDPLGTTTQEFSTTEPPRQVAPNPTAPASSGAEARKPMDISVEPRLREGRGSVPITPGQPDAVFPASLGDTQLSSAPTRATTGRAPDMTGLEAADTEPTPVGLMQVPEPRVRADRNEPSATDLPTPPHESKPRAETAPQSPSAEAAPLNATQTDAAIRERTEEPLPTSMPDLGEQSAQRAQVAPAQSPPRREPLPIPPSARVMVHIGSVSLEVSAEPNAAGPSQDQQPEPPRAPQTAARTSKPNTPSNGIWSGHRDFSRQYLRGF